MLDSDTEISENYLIQSKESSFFNCLTTKGEK